MELKKLQYMKFQSTGLKRNAPEQCRWSPTTYHKTSKPGISSICFPCVFYLQLLFKLYMPVIPNFVWERGTIPGMTSDRTGQTDNMDSSSKQPAVPDTLQCFQQRKHLLQNTVANNSYGTNCFPGHYTNQQHWHHTPTFSDSSLLWGKEQSLCMLLVIRSHHWALPYVPHCLLGCLCKGLDGYLYHSTLLHPV